MKLSLKSWRPIKSFVLKSKVLEETGQTKLCMAGGVALNCVANGEILRNAPLDDLFVHLAREDAP